MIFLETVPPEDAMKNVTVKKLEIESGESDLEEGEIPEFDVNQAAIKNNQSTVTFELKPHYEEHNLLNTIEAKSTSQLQKSQNIHRSYLRNNSNYFTRDGRYGPLPQVYCIPQEDKFVSGNQMLQDDIYDNKINERRAKYLHPYQTTYGSVEDIMTKIGETLGRSSNYYYKDRRSKEARRLLNLSNSRKIDAIHREYSPVMKKNTHHKRRKRRESESESESEIWDKKNKNKNKGLLNPKRKEKDFKKKRKREYTEIVLSDVSDVEITCEKKNSDETTQKIPRFPKTDLSTRLFKEIPLPQEKDIEVIGVDEVATADDSSESLGPYPATLDNKDAEKTVLDSADAANSDDCLANTNLSDQLSVNDEDKEDDIELIKLRLLALTSNKRKCQTLTDDSVNDSNDLKLNDEEKVNEISESEFVAGDNNIDNESQEGSSISNDKKIDNSCTDDIDRYELLLRAEALKTALLKKHQHRIKKPKNDSQNIAQNDKCSEYSLVNNEDKFISEKKGEKDEKCQEDDEKTIDLPVTNAQNSLGSKIEPNFKHPECSPSPIRDTEFQETDDLKSTSRGNRILRKKTRKKRCRTNRKSESLSESNDGFSDRPEEEEEDEDEAEKIKLQLLFDMNKKRRMRDLEKKSNFPSAPKVSSSGAVKSKQALELNLVNDTEKSANLVSEATKVPKTEIERIIVHLGSDSSDEEYVSQGNSFSQTGSVMTNESENAIPETNPMDYDKSVELLLSEARRRIEMKSQESSKVPSTPEAVYNHLPPSQRLEYIRLKQKIAEREKLKKMKEAGSDTSPGQGVKPDPAGKKCEDRSYPRTIEIKSSPAQKPAGNTTLPHKTTPNVKNRLIKKDFRTNSKKLTVNNFSSVRGLPNNNQVSNKLLSEMKSKNEVVKNDLGSKNGIAVNSVDVEKSILERKKILTQNRLHLERLKILWKKLKIEKMIEEKYMNEIKRLKAQQNIFELKINQQRLKIKKLAEESKQIYETFQKNNKGMEVNNKKKAPDKDKTPSGADLDENESTKVNIGEIVAMGAETSEPCLNEKNLATNNEWEVEKGSEDDKKKDESSCTQTLKDELKEYNSPLQSLSVGPKSEDCPKVDPNAIMCQYDILGKCNDEECAYQHVRS
ncbi:UNVERIFIED_CONTAM: hypothetical protein PYX00_008711 [Menopon gallinae]|uniref:Putative zinc-finger domain-containing protein n=1 Tax=Menopon gallinae TaxID=328185 RepID=A0AAW2HP42_9NEOP